jgi:hypothetical protein
VYLLERLDVDEAAALVRALKGWADDVATKRKGS